MSSPAARNGSDGPDISSRAGRFEVSLGRLFSVRFGRRFFGRLGIVRHLLALGSLTLLEGRGFGRSRCGHRGGGCQALVFDRLGIDIAHHVSSNLVNQLPNFNPLPKILARMSSEGLLGRKSGKGFYDYPSDKDKLLWLLLPTHFAQKPTKEQPCAEWVKKRLLYIQAVEAVRCLDENVVTSPADADIGSVLGWGFAPHTGGVISMVDTIGTSEFVAECDQMAQQVGKRFAPSERLRERAQNNRLFHDSARSAA